MGYLSDSCERKKSIISPLLHGNYNTTYGSRIGSPYISFLYLSAQIQGLPQVCKNSRFGHDRQTVLQHRQDKVLLLQEGEDMQEEELVGKVSQDQEVQEGILQGRHILLRMLLKI